MTVEEYRKQYWARLFSVAKTFDMERYKALAFKVNDRIC